MPAIICSNSRLPATTASRRKSSGFKKFVQENVTLDLARQLRIDVALEPGQVSETIDVTAAPPLVDTENGSLGTTVQNQMLTSLPNLSRNPQTLQLLSPGTINDPSNGIVTNGGLVRIDPVRHRRSRQ